MFNDLPANLQTIINDFAKNPLTYWNEKSNKELNDILSAFKSFEDSENIITSKNVRAIVKCL